MKTATIALPAVFPALALAQSELTVSPQASNQALPMLRTWLDDQTICAGADRGAAKGSVDRGDWIEKLIFESARFDWRRQGHDRGTEQTVTMTKVSLSFIALALAASTHSFAAEIVINTNFEGSSLGKVEKLGETQFRLRVEGQYDERGRNRQASWHFFQMENVEGRDLVLTFTDYVGEYNDKPGACAMTANTIPVFSYDRRSWRRFPTMDWDNSAKEATLRIRPEENTIWIAHIPPYTHSDLLRLLSDIDRSPHARVEVIGKTVQGRDLHLVTVTDFEEPDPGKKVVWLQARQHAWEAGTSFVMEGALRFITGDDAKARELRRRVVFKFTPMMDPDGCANGGVRFNANGYDVNRHWNEVDLRDKRMLRLMPEIWYVKRAIYTQMESGQPIDLMINMHNEEEGEHLATMVDDNGVLGTIHRLFDNLTAKTSFDPHKKLGIVAGTSTNCLWKEKRVPVLLMEQRISASKKLGRAPTIEDRLAFGRELVGVMAETVLE
jgi:hypothetical protein